jgi:hypothetical protein
MITIYDYIKATAPATLRELRKRYRIRKPRMVRADRLPVRIWVDDGPWEFWKQLMEEVPRPGREEIA